MNVVSANGNDFSTKDNETVVKRIVKLNNFDDDSDEQVTISVRIPV
jgi:hypothetical protein